MRTGPMSEQKCFFRQVRKAIVRQTTLTELKVEAHVCLIKVYDTIVVISTSFAIMSKEGYRVVV